MRGKNNKKISEQNAYFSESQLVIYFGMTQAENRQKFHLVLNELFEKKVYYQDEMGILKPLVEQEHGYGRFPKYLRVKNASHPLKLLARILQERGLDIYFFRDGLTPLQLRKKLNHQFGLTKINQNLERLYRFNAQFVDKNGFLQDLVLQNKKDTLYFLNPSEYAFDFFKQKMEKLAIVRVLTPARIAVGLGLHKGWGTHLEKQLSKMYLQNHIYLDEKGQSHALIKKYIIGGKHRFFLSSHPNALETFKVIYNEAKEGVSLSPRLEKLKQKNREAFYEELSHSYQEEVLFENESGKLLPLVEKRASTSNDFRLVIAPDLNAEKLFADRLKKRINEYELIKKSLCVSTLAKKFQQNGGDIFSLREMLEMLYDEKMLYMDSFQTVRPLVVKKNNKYFLMNDTHAIKFFQQHLKTFILSYSENPKTYLSFGQVVPLLDKKLTVKQFNLLLGEMQKEGMIVLNSKGQPAPIVQTFRFQKKIKPFLSDSPLALQLLKEKIKLREC